MVEAEAILSETVDAYRTAFGDRLVAAYALGSLAHGGFSALVSDVDLGLILADPLQSQDGDTIEAIAETQKQTGSALAERLSVFWGTQATLRGEREGGRFPPLDRLDLIENGWLLAGVDARTGLARPTADELLINGAEFALDFLAGLRSRSTFDGRPAWIDAPCDTGGDRRDSRSVLASRARSAPRDQAGSVPGSLHVHGSDQSGWHQRRSGGLVSRCRRRASEAARTRRACVAGSGAREPLGSNGAVARPARPRSTCATSTITSIASRQPTSPSSCAASSNGVTA